MCRENGTYTKSNAVQAQRMHASQKWPSGWHRRWLCFARRAQKDNYCITSIIWGMVRLNLTGTESKVVVARSWRECKRGRMGRGGSEGVKLLRHKKSSGVKEKKNKNNTNKSPNRKPKQTNKQVKKNNQLSQREVLAHCWTVGWLWVIAMDYTFRKPGERI